MTENASTSQNYVAYEMLPENMRDLHDTIGTWLFIASCYLNIGLAVMLLTERSMDLKEYRSVLLVQCAIDSFYTIVAKVTESELEIADEQVIIITNGLVKRAPMIWQHIAISTYIFAVHNCIYITPLMFVFRYFGIVREYMMSTAQILLFSLLIILTGLHQGVLTFLITYDSERPHADICYKLLNYTIWTRNGLDNCVTTKRLTHNVLVFYTITFVTVLNILIYVTMTYCTIKVLKRTREMRREMSSKTLGIQNQINRMLAVQWFLPFVSSILPIFVLISMPMFFSIHVPGVGILASLIFSAAPICSPLTTIFFLVKFRRRFLWRMTPLRFLLSAAAKEAAASSVTATAEPSQRKSSSVRPMF